MSRLLFAIAVILTLTSQSVLAAVVGFGFTAGTTDNLVTPTLSPELRTAFASVAAGDRLPVVVRFAPGTSSDEMTELLEKSGIENIEIRHAFHLISYISLYVSEAATEQISGLNTVVSVTSDHRRQIDPTAISTGYELAADGSGYTHPDVILGADTLWSQGYNGTGVTVAVLDTGLDPSHPDFAGRIAGFKDLVNDQTNSYDDNGHGTACAWLVAGTGEGMSGTFTGIAPGAKLLVVKVLDNAGSGYDSVIAQGIEYAVDTGADIMSLSLGGSWEDSAYVDPSIVAADAAMQAGVVVFIAAGNTGPAAETINSPGVSLEAITVGASSGAEGAAAFSSRGPVIRDVTDPIGVFAKPDIITPGEGVVSGRFADASTYEYPIYNQSQFGSVYTQWSGTSVSAPLAAGAAALLLDKHMALSPLEVKTFLMAGATDLNQDPMAQGYGIANVSRSSELIDATSRIYTLATPRAYPTLPDGQTVFIVGDTREPQDVSVISTANRGVADITLSGNASSLVNVSASTIDVVAGYASFRVGLKIPDNLALDAVGEYTGSIDLTAGATLLCSIELEFTVTTFGGRVLVDMAHHSSDDVDSPDYFKYFDEYLREQGMTMGEFPSGSQSSIIDYAALSMTDTFLIMDTELDYSGSEASALHSFVEDGGTLLVFSEFYNVTTQQASFGFDAYNQILEPYGIQCEKIGIGVGSDGLQGLVYGEDYGGSVENHSLTDGVRNLYVVSGSTLSVDSLVSGAEGLFWINSAKEHALIAVAEYGKGRVLVVSDGSMMYDDMVFESVLVGADNLRLLRNIAAYLVPDSPRIYDVEFNRGQIGEAANVTTFVFDDNLVDVNVTVLGPNGAQVNGTFTEELGYKFSLAFTLEEAGFYEVIVAALDQDGNERMFTRVFLVTVETVDPALILNVVSVLLGGVAIGLGAVAVLKFGRRKPPKKPQVEPGWEIPVQDDSDRPPTIE